MLKVVKHVAINIAVRSRNFRNIYSIFIIGADFTAVLFDYLKQ